MPHGFAAIRSGYSATSRRQRITAFTDARRGGRGNDPADVAGSLNLMMIGERDAFDHGVEIGRVRIIVFGMASVLVGTSVAASGSVGYVGLIVPHIVRLVVGSDNRLVVPMSAFAGAIFVVLADTVARTAIARELPVGAITALIGAPLFIFLLRRS